MTLQGTVTRRGRNLSEVELRYFRTLLLARDRHRDSIMQLENEILAALEGGCSLRSIAAQLGVSYTTVDGWAKNARARRR
jgi:DNA-binding NarL/FixJ family response regulator